MFNQRKSFFKGKLFYIILLALFGFGIWMNQAPAGNMDSNAPENVKADTKYPATTNSSVSQKNSGDDILDNIIGKNQTVTPSGTDIDEENIDTKSSDTVEPANNGYYLVKEVNGVIKVFYYDQEGKETLIRDTDIAFSLLSTADQALFRKGVIKHTTEELDELLQDFES